MNVSLPFGPPINTDIDYYQAYFILIIYLFIYLFWLVMRWFVRELEKASLDCIKYTSTGLTESAH